MITSIQEIVRFFQVACFALLLSTGTAYADNPVIREQITITAKELPMKNFLSEVEKQCSYTFFYTDSVMDGVANVTLTANEMPLQELLQKVLTGDSGLTYEIIGNVIAIKANPLFTTGGARVSN